MKTEAKVDSGLEDTTSGGQRRSCRNASEDEDEDAEDVQ